MVARHEPAPADAAESGGVRPPGSTDDDAVARKLDQRVRRDARRGWRRRAARRAAKDVAEKVHEPVIEVVLEFLQNLRP